MSLDGARFAANRVQIAKGSLQEILVTVTIYHNPNCGTSRKVLDMVRERGIEPKIVFYLDDPPPAAKLKALLKEMGMKPRDLLRKRGTPYEELGLDNPRLSDDEILALMVKHPLLIERPIVVTKKGAALCRPAEKVLPLL
jgi:arsenate reductase